MKNKTHKPAHSALLDNLRIELRSGCLTVAALVQLRVEHYGSSLRKALGDVGLEVEENTVYPMLRRLESRGLLVSEWREENGRKKRFYRISDDGEEILGDLIAEWQRIQRALGRILPKAA